MAILAVALSITLLVFAVVLIAVRNSKRRRESLHAAYQAGREAARAEAPSNTGVSAPAHEGPPGKAIRFVRHTLPTQTRREGYWRSPPAPLATDDQIRTALAKAHPQIQVCFTGWSDAEKAALITLADEAGFRTMTAVSKHLTLLVAGESPGPVKLVTAAEVGAAVVSGDRFESLAAYKWPAHGMGAKAES